MPVATKGKHVKKKIRHVRRGRLQAMALPFFAALGALAIVSAIIPLRPTESMSEKRSLALFPTFSVTALFSGSYFDDISTWFSDTFPGREGWIAASAAVESLHGVNDVTFYGDFSGADAIPSDSAAATPAATEAPLATPAPTPPPTPEVVETSPPTESVEHWGGIDGDNQAEVVFGNVIQIGDSAFAYYGFSQYYADRHVKIMDNFAAVMDEYDIDVYDVLIPTSVGVLVSSDFMEQVKCTDQGESISYIFSQESEQVKKVNAFNNLIAHNDEYLYFRTDHHWTALGAYYAYESFCDARGFQPRALADFTEYVYEGFLGSFYSQCNQSSKLRRDDVHAYDPPGDIEMWITAAEGNTFPWPILTDMTNAAAEAKYMTFLGGDHPMTKIVNNDLPDAPSCIVVKDSFGNPFVPFLTQNYHTIYAIDYRKYTAMQLRYFVQYYDVDDVLVVESLAMAQGQGTTDLLSWLLA